MSDPSSQNLPALERVFELLDNKFVSWGASGVLLAAGVRQIVVGDWLGAGGLLLGAGGLWLVIKVGKRLAPKVEEALDWGIGAGEAQLRRIWGLSSFERQFLQRQAYLCEEDRIEGYERDGDRIPLLEEVFVPLGLSAAGMQMIAEDLGQELRSALGQRGDGHTLQIWDLLAKSKKDRRFRQISVLAKGGMGKTTLLRHVALRYGQGKLPRKAPSLIPVLLRLRTLIDVLTQAEPPSLPTLITEVYLPTLSDFPAQPPDQWARNLLVVGRALVLLDGFDEVPELERPSVSHWISGQIQQYPKAVFIVTSRPAGFTPEFYQAPRPALTVYVQSFSPAQQEQFIQRWYFCQECVHRTHRKQRKHAKDAAQERAASLVAQIQERREELGYMAENPLLLNMLATFHRQTQGQPLPRQRLELYQRIVQLQLEDRPRARFIPRVLPYAKSVAILQQVALKMVQVKRAIIAKDSLIRLLSTLSVWEEESVDSAEWVKQVVTVAELLVEREPEEYEFPHASFQGFFAASYLAKAEQEAQIKANIALILENWEQATWKETVLLYAAQLNPKLLGQVLRKACQIDSAAAQLALDCLKEYPRPDKIDPQLQRELEGLTKVVTDAKYQQLEAYLATGEWRKADEETYRLMITTVGKEEGQWFEREELLNFPCEDLLTIDGLWRKYSQDRYGFSVQKKIYVKCGGRLDGRYPSDTIWEAFGEEVGWRVNNSWVDYVYLDFGGTGVLGHLPVFGGSFRWWVSGGYRSPWFYRCASIFSHRDL